MKRIAYVLGAAVLLTGGLAAAGPAPAPAGRSAKVCFTCHKSVEEGTLRGHFEEASLKASSVLVKVDGESLVLRFDKGVFQVLNAPEQGDLEKQLRSVKKGAEVRVAFAEKGDVRVATLLSVKPKLKVAAEKLVKTEEVEKLVQLGPEKGGYRLFDARPGPRFLEGHIPTAVSLPFPAFEKEKEKLPADKDTLLVFYCSGVT